MPFRVTNPVTTGGEMYASPFVGDVGHTAQIAVNIANLTTSEVDANGWLKPGVPLTQAGALVGAAAAVFGVTIEAIKLVANNGAARTGTFQIAVGTIGQVNRKVCEDNLGRVLSANEIAGFGLAGSTLKLLA
jgi:hypothetical protein